MFDSLASWVVYQLLSLKPGSHFADALHFFIMDTAKIFFMLAVIIYIMGLFRAFLSPEKVRQYIRNKPQWQARSMAVSLGAVTPFCSCSSVPLFIGFVEAGIPLGVTFSFLIASPMINEVAVVILAGILGWKLALLYVASGLIVAWFGGIAMQWFKSEQWVESYVWDIKMGKQAQLTPGSSLKDRHQYAIAEVKEITRRIWKWVFLGIGIGAIFHGYVPEDWVTNNLASGNWYDVPTAVLLGVPLYSNATGIIPVAEAMLNKGVAIGTTLSLMMSVAALSLPELIILRKVIKWQALALFVLILSLSFILVGWGFNLLV